MQSITQSEYDCLSKIFDDNNVCISHGIDHAKIVMINAHNALESLALRTLYMQETANNICMAAFLHDADDRKFFPNNKNYENARKVLSNRNPRDVSVIIDMIDAVSASSNKDSHMLDVHECYYYPRYADRLESIGYKGVERCFKYTQTTKTKLYVKGVTQLCFTKDEIMNIMGNRYELYTGHSESMIDHYYDKLLHICELPEWIHNEFLINEFKKRKEAMFDFIIYFSNTVKDTNDFTDDDIHSWLNIFSV